MLRYGCPPGVWAPGLALSSHAMTGVMASAKGGSFVPTQGWAGSKSGVVLAKAVQARSGSGACALAHLQGELEPARLLHGDGLRARGEGAEADGRAGTQKLNPAVGTDAGMVATKDSPRRRYKGSLHQK